MLDHKRTNEEIGKAIRKIRKEKKVTQEQLSELTGIGRTAITKYEKGTIEISMHNFITICNALNADYASVLQSVKLFEIN